MNAYNISFSAAPLNEIRELLQPPAKADALVLPLCSTETGRASWIHPALDAEISRLVSQGLYTGCQAKWSCCLHWACCRIPI